MAAVMDPDPAPWSSLSFGRFQLLPHRRELLAGGTRVELSSRAFDVLLALIEARGGIVANGVLIARAWPDRVVTENALQAQISALRTAFGPDRELIRTVPEHGYQFTGETSVRQQPKREPDGAAPVAGQPQSAVRPTNIPEPVSSLIGRDDELREVLGLAASHRLVTLTGAGGIGKTRLAFAAARTLLPDFADGVWAAELASLAEPGLVPVAVAAAVGLDIAGGTASPERVASALRGKRTCSCSTIANMSSIPRPRCARRCSAPTRHCGSSRRAANRSRLRASWSMPYPRSPSPPSLPKTMMIPWTTAPSGCFSTGCVRSIRISRRTGPGPRRWRRSAAGSTACPWRSSWPRHGLQHSASRNSPSTSMTASAC